MLIYRLKDPRTNEIFYIGKTTDHTRRLEEHKLHPLRGNTAAWIRHIQNDKLNPILEIIEECLDEDASGREKFWIEKYLADGCLLTNKVWAKQYLKKQGGIKSIVEHNKKIFNRIKYGYILD